MNDYVSEENSKVLEDMADLLGPITEIAKDKKFTELLKGSNKLKAIEYVLREHKAAAITILAIYSGVKPSEYKANLITTPLRLLKLLNDPDIMGLF